MKRIAIFLVCVLMLSLCGCSFMPTSPTNTPEVEAPVPEGPTDASDIETLMNWSFQYNEGTNDYSIFFALLKKADQYVSADVDVDVRIVNDNGSEVYKATHFVTEDDFGYYTNQTAGEQFLANLRIPASEIVSGTVNSGKVYLTVYKDDYLRFDEVNCDALYCLPVLDVQLVVDELPVELNVTGFGGGVESKIEVEEVTYIYNKDLTSQLQIAIAGTKTYGGAKSTYDIISYKLYDSEGYVVASGNVYLSGLAQGDKFRDDSISVFDVIPGETYTLLFSEYSW